MLGNLGELMKLAGKAKEIQSGMKKLRDELPGMEFSATGANGAIKVVVAGDFSVKKLEIVPGTSSEIVERELALTINSALAAARMTMQERMKNLTGDLGIDLPIM